MQPLEPPTAQAGPKATRTAGACTRAGRRRLRWVLAGTGAIGILVASVAVLATLVQPPRPISLVTVGADYADNLSVPHNAYGWNSLCAACRLADEAPSAPFAARSLYQCGREPARVDERFDFQQATDGLTCRTGVLLVSLHGGADDRGPYLLRENATPYDPESHRLRVADLLSQLADLPAAHHKLLIFDATAIAGATAYGEAENGFAQALRSLNEAIAAVPNLIVVSASDVGERSWEEPSAGRTVFLHTLLESLRGAACDLDQDGRLDAEELFAHVRATVSARVSVTRQRTQTLLVLPLGEEGRERARRVEVGLANPAYHAEPLNDNAVDSELIAAQWERVEGLESQLKGPETKAPVAWRHYRRLVMRHEQLLLAGATAAAQRVAETLSDLESRLRREVMTHAELIDPVQLRRPTDSSQLGRTADQLMADLVASPRDLLGVAADKALQGGDPATHAEMRRLLYDRLIRLVRVDPIGSLRQAAAIAEAISVPDQAAPAEAHLLTLLATGLPADLSDPAWPGALRLATEARELAEETLFSQGAGNAFVAPALLPWLRDRHAAADQRRRHGEDLLFGGVDYLPRAVAELEAARLLYNTIREDARTLRAAFRTRDLALDRLPFYTDAVAAMRAVHGDDPAEITNLAERVQSAWETAHALGDALVAAESTPADSNASVAPIAAASEAAERAIDSLRVGMRTWRYRLITGTGASLYNNRLAALSVPEMGAGERLQLLSVSPPDADDSATDQRALRLCKITQADWRAEETRRRAGLALASVGKRIFRLSTGGSLTYRQALDLVEAPSPRAGDPTATDTRPVDLSAATRVARDVLELRRSVRESLAPSNRRSLAAELTPHERRRLAHAGAAARRLAWGRTPSKAQSLLAERARRNRWEYFAWRAERALDDAWGGAKPNRPFYSRLAATAYARLAERALPGQPATDRLLRRAAQPFQFHVVAPPRVDLVADVPADLPIRATASTPTGHAVVTVEASPALAIDTPANDARILASLSENDVAETPAAVVHRMGADADPPDRTPTDSVESIAYHGWFRGHRVTETVPVFVHRVPDIEIDNPPRPSGAGVAITAAAPIDDGEIEGGIALVLDASGSMGPVAEGQPFKYAEAVETLRTLLQDAPAGVQVSVWVFGQAIGAAKTADNAELAVERVLEPTRWDPADPALLNRVIDRLAYPRIEPWNESALVRTLLAASRDLRSVSGYRAVIAITDGIDNRFAQDSVANPRRQSIAKVVTNELAGSGIALHVVGFRVADAERTAAQTQFAFLDQLDPPGRWWEAAERVALAETLTRVLGDHLLTSLAGSEPGGIVRSVSDAFVTPVSTAPVWPHEPLSPGLYALPQLGDAARQQALLAGGDLLLLSAAKTPGNPTFRHAAYSASQAPAKPAVETGGWRAALLNHRRLPDGSTSSLVAIERRRTADDRPPTLLQLERPTDVWVEADGASGASHRLALRRVDGYPAPCWEVLRRNSQGTASDPRELTFWWTPPGGAGVTRAIRRGEEFERSADLVGRSWDVQGQPTTIRRLSVVQRLLPDASGKPVRQSCLVIELDGGPLCGIRLRGITADGCRHHRYETAKRSVSVFWPVAPEQLRDQLEGIDLTSVADLQREAERRGLVATFPDLPPASPSDLRPTPAVGWFGPQTN